MDKERICEGAPVDLAGSIHVVVSSKGGIGKTFVARLLAEAILYGFESGDVEKGDTYLSVYDVDAANLTLTKTRGLNAKPAEIFVPDSNEVVTEKLDEYFLPGPPDEVKLFDLGSAGYLEIVQYLMETNVPGIWRRAGRKFFFHVPICGYERLNETLLSLAEVMYDFPSANVFVWCNDYLLGRETGNMTSVQKWLDRQDSRGLTADSDLPALGDIVEAFKRHEFAELDDAMLGRIFVEMMAHTDDLKRYILLANFGARGFKHMRSSIGAVLNGNLTFSGFISDPSANVGDRSRIADFVFDREAGAFRNIYQALGSINA